jgi:predicted MFS family arabinose efflux permease
MNGAPRPHYQVTFGILAVGIGAFALLQSLVIPVLSTVQAELHTSQSAVTWVLTAYLLSDPEAGRRDATAGVRDHPR